MLDTALGLFSAKGYHNVSMHEIAGKAEFAIGTVYKFFKNKEDLYKALIMRMAGNYHETLMEVLSAKDDIFTIFENYIATKIKVFSENADALRLYFAEARGASFNIKAGLDKDVRCQHEKLVNKIASVLETGVRKKVIRKLAPYYMAVALEGTTNAFLFCWLEDPTRHPYEANVPIIKDIFLNASWSMMSTCGKRLESSTANLRRCICCFMIIESAFLSTLLYKLTNVFL